MRADRRQRRLDKQRYPGLEALEQRVVMDAGAPWSDLVASGSFAGLASTASLTAAADVSAVDFTTATSGGFTTGTSGGFTTGTSGGFTTGTSGGFTTGGSTGGAGLGTTPAAPPTLQMTVQQTVTRGSAAAFILTLPGPAGPGGASLSFRTADIGAKAGVDYRAKTGRVTFAPGESVKQVAVETIAGLPASSKPLTMGLVLSQPVGVKLGTTLAVTTIVNREQQFNRIFGYGLVNSAAAVAQASGRIEPFAPVPNLGGNAWGEDLVNAPESWARSYTGRGVVVAVIDSGVDYRHPDLASNIWVNTREIPADGIDNDANGFVDDIRGWNFNGNLGRGSNDPMDDDGHGTHVAGTIAALRNGVGVTGVAPNAKIMPLKVKNPTPPTFDDYHNSVAQAIRYAVDNGARVINMSIRTLPDLFSPTIYFGSRPVAAIQDALAYAASRNVIAVMAAGNSQESASFSGYPEEAAVPLYPARYSTMYGLSVGALDRNGQIASFSNYAGTSPSQHQVMAPGVDVYSTLPGGTYGELSGTSMASPHVAGVVALMVGANPRVTSNQVRSIVTSTSQRLTGAIITARPSRAASLPLLAAAPGIDQPMWVVPGSPVAAAEPTRPVVAPLAPTGAATISPAAFAAVGGDDLSLARRLRPGSTAATVERPTVADGGRAADGLLPRTGLKN
jgi:subtilisin family serine protease